MASPRATAVATASNKQQRWCSLGPEDTRKTSFTLQTTILWGSAGAWGRLQEAATQGTTDSMPLPSGVRTWEGVGTGE